MGFSISWLAVRGKQPDDVLRNWGSGRRRARRASGGAKAGVDYVFDVPLAAAKLVTGFSHDEAEPPAGFAVLAPVR
jgi:hypothetical protein